MKQFKFHEDAGHGWLAVKADLVQTLGIADKITQFSYINGKTVYLEEDCDAPLFARTYRERVGEFEVTRGYRERSPIRDYPRYDESKLKNNLDTKKPLPF
jgi:hypothetical protein